jgi:hypothetical protein
MTGPVPGSSASLGGPAVVEVADLAAFCARVLRLDPAALVRLRQVDDRLTAYSRLPLDVLVSRTVHGGWPGFDRTVGAADLLAALEAAEPGADQPAGAGGPAGGGFDVARGRDAEWRGSLPPVAGWRRLDAVPVAEVENAVRAGMAAFDTVRGGPDATAIGESLLDHEALTVTDGEHRAVLPLRVLHAVWRMGFLGAEPRRAGAECPVSVAGGWARLAAPHGTAYHRAGPGLSLGTR